MKRVLMAFNYYSNEFLRCKDIEPLTNSLWVSDIGKHRDLNSKCYALLKSPPPGS